MVSSLLSLSSLSTPGNMKYLCAWNKVIARPPLFCPVLKRFYVTTPTPTKLPPFLHTPLSYTVVRYSITRSFCFCRPLPFTPSSHINYFIFENDRRRDESPMLSSSRCVSSAPRAFYPSPPSSLSPSDRHVIDGYRRTTPPD